MTAERPSPYELSEERKAQIWADAEEQYRTNPIREGDRRARAIRAAVRSGMRQSA